MTIEEAKVFLDNLKVCVEEHPIVADWLVEIANRKTEPQSEKCVGNKATLTINNGVAKVEPQVETSE